MMLETSKKVAELTQGSLRAGMKITPNGPFLAPRAPYRRLKTHEKHAKNQNWAKQKIYLYNYPLMIVLPTITKQWEAR